MGGVTALVVGSIAAGLIGQKKQADAQKAAARQQTRAIKEQEAAARRAAEQADLEASEARKLRSGDDATGAKVKLGASDAAARPLTEDDLKGTSKRKTKAASVGGFGVSASSIGGL